MRLLRKEDIAVNDKSILPDVPRKSESTSLTVVVGVANWTPKEDFLESCRSVTYTVGASSEPADHFGAEPPEAFATGSVRALKGRLRSRVSSSEDHDSSKDF